MAGKRNSSTGRHNGKVPDDSPFEVTHEREINFGQLYRADYENSEFRELKNAMRVIYFMLVGYLNAQRQDAFPSQRRLARESGFNRRTVIRAIKELERVGFIRRLGNRPKGNVVWQICAFKSKAP